MAQKVGVQRSQVGSQVVLTAKTTRRGFSQVPQPTLLQMVTGGDRGLMYHQAMTSFVSSLWKTVG